MRFINFGDNCIFGKVKEIVFEVNAIQLGLIAKIVLQPTRIHRHRLVIHIANGYSVLVVSNVWISAEYNVAVGDLPINNIIRR